MSNAEQAWKVEAERKRWGKLPTTTYNPVHDAFHLGYARGRAAAWQLPEVPAEELVLGKSYEATNKDGEVRCCFAGLMKGGQIYVFFCGNPNEHLAKEFSFRGPLPLGDA